MILRRLIMGEQINILLNRMFTFFTLIAIGFAVQRIKLLTESSIDALSSLVVRLILPCMICTNVVNGATIQDVFIRCRNFYVPSL